MKLSDLQQLIDGAELIGGDADVLAVVEDSRQVGPNIAFVAVRGRTVDGHAYLDAAVSGGACAVVVEQRMSVAIPQLVVPSTALALGKFAAAVRGNPARALCNIAITGTNGKTTTTYLVEAILKSASKSPGVLGTVNYRYGGNVVAAPYTTPTAPLFHDTLAEFVAEGCTHSVLEASSAALEMGRLAGTQVDVAAFTNFTQDHLDLHDGMDAYRAAKALLFSEHLAEHGVAVINMDDPAGPAMVAAAGGRRVLTVSRQGPADVRIETYTSTVSGVTATIATPTGTFDIQSPALVGGYNVDNVALAVGIAEALGIEHRLIAKGLADMPGVPGRVERVENTAGLDILVDYAHTPDALENVLRALRPLTARRLICVFGCGGDRDPQKRPLMGAAVTELADLAVVTSDNPRTEDPQSIIDMIMPTVPNPFFVDADRSVAIAAAVHEATPGDVVLIAGKGHEDYQILGTKKIHFDDREQAAQAVASRWNFDVKMIQAATGAATRGVASAPFSRVIIDGRMASPGDLYVAIVGERFDGHDFVAQAAMAGATGAVVRRGFDCEVPSGFVWFHIDDPREALGRIAAAHRRRWGESGERNLIAITGSSGKTTVKEMTRAACAGVRRVHASAGSLNNETGVPLTMLGLRPYHDVAVVEMGMRGLGQIRYLTQFADPDVGVVVNAQMAHVGEVGNVDDIARGKGEMFATLRKGAIAVCPHRDERLVRHVHTECVTFGDGDGADVQLVAYGARPDGVAEVEYVYGELQATCELHFVGRHNATNGACAVAAATALGIAFSDAVRGLEKARPEAMRSEIAHHAGRNVFLDCYNANPQSMAAAIATVADLAGDHEKVAVLGDMLELGSRAAEEHVSVGRQAAEAGMTVVAMGEFASQLVAGATEAGGEGVVAASIEAAANEALSRCVVHGWILVKGSRGMRLERVVEAINKVGN